MTEYLIQGSEPLNGELKMRGAKNAALPVLIAAAAGRGPVNISNVPIHLRDVLSCCDALRHIGCQVNYADDHVMVTSDCDLNTELPLAFSAKFRSALVFLGLLLGRCGRARVEMPGGCKIGERRYDLHLHGLECLGARISQTDDAIEVEAPRDGLSGGDVEFYLPTTTGTQNVMLAACFAKGTTRIINANTRPENVDMADCLNKMGACISVRNRIVEIEGGRELSGCSHHVMPGWDEALTYILAAGMTRGEICIRDFSTHHIRGDVSFLKDAGLELFEWGGHVFVSGKNRPFRKFDLFTAPYPGVNSDMQPLFSAFASQCSGESSITDQRFTDRFQYAGELRKMGVPVEVYGNCAVVHGPASLRGARVRALDLRCGAALVLAGLAAEGETVIENAEEIERGYEHMPQRLAALGARVQRSGGPGPESEP